ncbi:SDR family oxidoreductase [Streptomyces sp. WMMC500]|uniref:SDR family oxidoreductase n=1 Tax=Streptomyces sp. WMMC500 TaxID=3015154 RepID=UPI00248CB686|nr:SDR family oxidoreductase [Streptomyces sp. WMMC500]WBB63209.1 SDR family oxidoreductase [Streptomyces sp. WMMC500]
MGALTGKTALVTGASRGIGRAIAERLGRDGARVAVHYGSNEAAAKETVAAIEAAGGEAFAIRAELGVPGDAAALWAEFDRHADGLDILVNNAGVALQALIEDTEEADFDRLFAVNTRAPFFVTKLGLPRLRDGGRIVNVSTVATHAALMPPLLAYTMSKGAVDAFTKFLSKSVGERGITVNAIGPGALDTDMNADWLRDNDDAKAGMAAVSPLRRIPEVSEVADQVAYLASPAAGVLTGLYVDVSGGVVL